MYNTIVVGTDGSSTAAIAVERASEIARLTGARLHVVSSYHPVPSAARRPRSRRGVQHPSGLPGRRRAG